MRKCGCHSHNGLLLSPEGLAQRTSLEGLAPMGEIEYVDKVGSVSALVEVEENYFPADPFIEEQYRRFLNGS